MFNCSDADLERLLEQWEEDEEPLPADELPEGHPDKPVPPIDLSKVPPDIEPAFEYLLGKQSFRCILIF